MNDSIRDSAPWITRRTALAGIGAGGIGLLLADHLRSPAHAQEATPTGPVGLTVQWFGTGLPASAPGLQLSLLRMTIAPGGSLPPHSHPGAMVFFIESGVSRYIPLGGSINVTRAVTEGTPAAAEAVAIGSEVILRPGDSVFVEDDPQDEAYNDGEEDLVILFAGLTRQGEPFTKLM